MALLLAALDHLTGFALSFDAFYVLLVVMMTVAGGYGVGLWAAGAMAVVWTGSDVLIRELGLGPWGATWNVLVRFVALGTVTLLVTTLVSSVARARSSAELSRQFLGAAAHQLRTPVAAVRASVEAIVHAGPGAAQERQVANAMRESARLGRLVGSLLRVARLDEGERAEARLVDVRSLLAAEAERMGDVTAVEVQLCVSADVPLHVHVDPAATAEALANVLHNACRHATRRVVIEAFVDRSHVVLAVADDGPGLPPGAEDLAFGRFVSLDGAGGSGLGLPIARALARQQGGDLAYRDKRFLLSLPATPPQRGTRRGGQRGGPST